jgi:plasmid stabilization system protein ParE
VKVRLSAGAERDLDSIGDRIAGDDPLRAISFVGEIQEACLGLAGNRGAFPILGLAEFVTAVTQCA